MPRHNQNAVSKWQQLFSRDNPSLLVEDSYEDTYKPLDFLLPPFHNNEPDQEVSDSTPESEEKQPALHIQLPLLSNSDHSATTPQPEPQQTTVPPPDPEPMDQQ